MSERAARTLDFVHPTLTSISGGTLYNEALVRAWPQEILPLRTHTLRRLEDLDPVPPGSRLLIDGLLASAEPAVVERARRAGCAVTLLVHMPAPADPALTERERERRARLEARALRAASTIVTTSRFAAGDLRDRYGAMPVTVATPGAERAAVSARHDPPGLLQLAAISVLKNQLVTIRAAADNSDLSFRLRLAGPTADDEYAAQVRQAAGSAPWDGAGAQLELLGEVTGEDRESLYAATDLVISVGRFETWGLTVTEALARGIPAIVGRGTGAQEALTSAGRPSVPGAAVDTQDPGELARVLRRWLTEPLVRERWRAAALQARAALPEWSGAAATVAQACLRARFRP